MTQPLPIDAGHKVFVLTGAGVSAESGLRTFRDSNGLWEQHRVEDVASPEGFARDPALVWRFYAERRRQAAACAPNRAHLALAQLEARLQDRLLVCTQNVDDLHERAGSTRVVHMHGELRRSRFDAPGSAPFTDDALYFSLDDVPRDAQGRLLRPHICWFGEVPFEMDRILAALGACSWFLTVGTSGSVYPAAGFVEVIRQRQAAGQAVRSVYVGLEVPDNASAFAEVHLGPAGTLLPQLLSLPT